MNKRKENTSAFIKTFFIIFGLIGATILLLQVPSMYFEKADKQLLSEQGRSEYVLKPVIAEKISIEEKLDVFRDNVKEYWFGEPEIWKDDTLHAMEKTLADELDLLLNGLYAPITIALREEMASSEGFQVRIIYEGKEDKRYSWEIGLLYFDIPDISWGGVIIFDVESSQIFVLEMNCSVWESDNVFGDKADFDDWIASYEAYYRDIDVWENFDGVCDKTHVALAAISFENMLSSGVLPELINLYDKLSGRYSEENAEKILN